MGGGISISFRLRKALLMRAYNVRSKDSVILTIEDQFRPYAFKSNDGKLEISLESIRKCLNLEDSANWVDNMLKEVLNQDNQLQTLSFKAFIEFLETGKTIKQFESENVNIIATSSSNSSLPSPPISISGSENNIRNTSANNTTTSQPPQGPQPQESMIKNKDHVIINNTTSTTLVKSQPRVISFTRKDVHRVPPTGYEGKQMWRKRETVKQERTVEYTTIDENGESQELVESEIQQTEILHMECRETGEFAHRETTRYEQTEVFNNEVALMYHISTLFIL